MKKMMMLALALVMMLTLTGAALAESAPMSKEDQMKNMVQGFLDENGYEYEYDDYTFSMSWQTAPWNLAIFLTAGKSH